MLALVATGKIVVNGSVNVIGAGFRGGAFGALDAAKPNCEGLDEVFPLGAQKGEGFVLPNWSTAMSGRGNNDIGGGRGVCGRAGGGGGGNFGGGGTIWLRTDLRSGRCDALQVQGGAGGNLKSTDQGAYGPGGGGGGGMIMREGGATECKALVNGGVAGLINGTRGYGATSGGEGKVNNGAAVPALTWQ